MLTEIFKTGLQAMHIVGLLCLLFGVFSIIGVVAGGRNVLLGAKGVLLMLLGAYLMGLAQNV